MDTLGEEGKYLNEIMGLFRDGEHAIKETMSATKEVGSGEYRRLAKRLLSITLIAINKSVDSNIRLFIKEAQLAD